MAFICLHTVVLLQCNLLSLLLPVMEMEELYHVNACRAVCFLSLKTHRVLVL